MTTTSDKPAGAVGLASDALSGTVQVVTGSTQGLGAEIARTCAALGAKGVVLCGRNEEKGRLVAEEVRALGAEPLFVSADLSEVASCRRVIQAADERFGRVDGLVNAAATTERGTVFDTSEEAWDRIFDLNVKAPFFLLQEAARVMKREGKGGRVVNVLSMSAHGGQPFITPYSTSKGALATLTKNAAYALRGDGIRVYGVNMGWCATDAEHQVQLQEGKPADWLKAADEKAPFGRIQRPGDVARLCAFLLGAGGEMMTGAILDFNAMVVGAFD